jgi:hypothetical protein
MQDLAACLPAARLEIDALRQHATERNASDRNIGMVQFASDFRSNRSLAESCLPRLQASSAVPPARWCDAIEPVAGRGHRESQCHRLAGRDG